MQLRLHVVLKCRQLLDVDGTGFGEEHQRVELHILSTCTCLRCVLKWFAVKKANLAAAANYGAHQRPPTFLGRTFKPFKQSTSQRQQKLEQDQQSGEGRLSHQTWHQENMSCLSLKAAMFLLLFFLLPTFFDVSWKMD